MNTTTAYLFVLPFPEFCDDDDELFGTDEEDDEDPWDFDPARSSEERKWKDNQENKTCLN